MTADDLAAEGWKDLGVTHFSATAGPYWVRRDAEGVMVGLLTDERHNNGHLGTVHGGVLMTFADIALGVRVTEAIGAPHCATSQLSFNFVGAAVVGSFITCRPELVRKTSQLVFVRALFRSGERVIGTSDGIFSVLDQAKLQRLRGLEAGSKA
jgi:acyl-coenzyme A thioesterase PaaI-like protein